MRIQQDENCKGERKLSLEANPVRPQSKTSKLQNYEKISVALASQPMVFLLEGKQSLFRVATPGLAEQ